MEPAEYNITLYRDRDFSQRFIFKDGSGIIINLTGYTVKAQIRPVKDSSELIVTFTTTVTHVSGIIDITLSDVQTLALTQSKAWWDLELTNPSGLRENYIEGSVVIKGTVTRA